MSRVFIVHRGQEILTFFVWKPYGAHHLNLFVVDKEIILNTMLQKSFM